MKEGFLKAILHILAIVAKEANVTHHERESVRDFLALNLREHDVENYLGFFDKTVECVADNNAEQDKEEIKNLCSKLNHELTQLQKVIAIANLMMLIAADGIITEQEHTLLYLTSDCFKLNKHVTHLIESFVMANSPEKADSKYVLLIDSEEKGYSTSKHLFCSEIDGFIAVLRISIYQVHFIKYVGTDEIFLNGIPLRSRTEISFFAPGSVIKTRKNTFYHSDIIRFFVEKRIQEKIVFTTKNLTFAFRDKKIGLRDISIQEKSGKLVAIMGGSGSGKSTLVNVLNGNYSPIAGEVTINGVSVHDRKPETVGLIGYVPAEDLLIEDLTVLENLSYSSKLCFGNLTNAEIKTLADKTLKMLGLYDVKDLKVGSKLDKIISGGQRKRLNISLELIRKPAILFLDEPTSGLSSRDSEKVMALLKDLTLKGTLIFTIIHQPSSEIVKMLDRLLILDTGGRQIYYGNPVQAIHYFKTAVDRIDRDQGQCIECGNVNAEDIFSIIEHRIIDELGRETDRRKILPPTWEETFQKSNHSKMVFTKKHTSLPKCNLHVASRLRQISLFTQRDVKAKLANTQYILLNLLEPAILAGILGYITRYSEKGKSYIFAENTNIAPYFLISIIVALFMGLMISSQEIFKDRKILKREAFLQLNRSSYLCSKLIILFSLSAIQTLTYVLVGNYILDIGGMTFSYWLILFSVSCFANLSGLNVSDAFHSVATIYIVVPLLLIPQIILSGSVINFDQLSPHLASQKKVPWVGELIASRWAFEAAVVTQFKDNPYNKHLYPFNKKIGMAEYYTSHWVPCMENYLRKGRALQEAGNIPEATQKLKVVQNEIRKQIAIYGAESFPLSWEKIDIRFFDDQVYDASMHFVGVIKKIHATLHKTTNQEKEKYIRQLATTEKDTQLLFAKKEAYKNEKLNKLIKNLVALESIVEEDDELVQVVFPIYAQPTPTHALDFRTRMFFPVKHIFGYYISTLYFNILVIWFMTALLLVCLYYRVFRAMIVKPVRFFQRMKD